MSQDLRPVTRALLSVSDKAGIVDFARTLGHHSVELVSTGGTAKALADAGLAVRDVADVTGFPEMMDGRVKTLHPHVHGGLLSVRDNAEHQAAAAEHGIQAIDLLVVNLYPFEKTVAAGASRDVAIENIDIGGPAMIRAAAKNHDGVAVVVDPGDYACIAEELAANNGALCLATRARLAQKAFARTAAYDAAISNYLGLPEPNDAIPQSGQAFPSTFTVQFNKVDDLRYGENPHQDAAFYVDGEARAGTVASARQLQGKALSFNNLADTDAALSCIKAFTDKPTCVIVKHANPCGVAEAETLLAAYQRAYETDSESAFGGIIALNQPLDAETASAIVAQQFVEVIVAPSVATDALAVLADKANVRVLATGVWSGAVSTDLDYKKLAGGLLLQTADAALMQDLRVVTKRQPTAAELADMLFAWRVAKYVKSNAIVYAKAGGTVGIGAGQMSRINASRIAVIKAEHANLSIAGTAVASDAFFPFADGLLSAVAAGATAVIQPGGSLRDADVIAAADANAIAMVFTGMRHFRH